MGQKLKTYQIQLTVKGPVFIGDGNVIYGGGKWDFCM